jgi:glycine/D-amino acid oxidase-like deaminating enzyme
MSNFGPELAPDSLWRATAGAAPALPVQPLPTHADVVIIGGGYTGLWTALHLLREAPDLDVVVLERSTVGFGASGRNGGWASALFPTSMERIAAFSSREGAIAMQRAMYRVVDELSAWTDEEGIDCEYAKGGTITVARNAAQVQSMQSDITHAHSWGASDEDVHLLDAQQTLARIGMDGALAGKYTPHCAAIHPLKLVHGLARAVSLRGGVILEGTAALSYSPGVVSTNRGVITCDSVVRATEGFTARFGAHVREVMPVYSLMIATEPLSASQWESIGLHERETFTEQRHVVIYGQRTADGRLAFGGRGAPYHWGSAIDARFDMHRGVHRGLHKTLLELFPMLAATRVTHRWGGALGIPRDYMPFVRFADGVGAAGGYVGDGVASAALAGRTMADLVLQRNTERTALPWVNHTSRKWEPEPLRWIEANGMLAGLSVADRMEATTGKPSPLADLLYRFL